MMQRDGRPGWHGIFPSLPTPFTPGGEIDGRAMRAIVRYVLAQGAHGVLSFGLAGEVFKLAPAERKRLTDVIVEETGRSVPVLIGVSAESLYTACDLARYAEQAGADGIVIAPPITTRLSGSETVEFISRVADSVQLPVMVQDAPEYLGVEVGPSLVAEIAKRVTQVQYVKLEIGPDGVSSWLDELQGAVDIFGGNGGLHLLECARAGAVGIAPGSEVVDLLVRIYESERAGDSDKAEAEFREFLPFMIFAVQDIDHYNACAKYVLAKRGVELDIRLRDPAPVLSSRAMLLLDQYIAELRLAPSRRRPTSTTT